MRLWKIRCIRLLLSIFRIFPVVNHRIVFVCNYGKSYACNPKYVFKALREKYGEKLQYVWVLNEKHPELERQAVQVKNKSMAFFYYMMTARVIVGNNALGSYLPKRSSQCFINTWHGGGAYKKVHFDVAVSDTDRKIYEIFARQTDCHLSSSKMFTECMAASTKVQKDKFLEIGMPRNDCLFRSFSKKGQMASKEAVEDTDRILKRLGVPKELWQKKILLYAPTFRGETNHGYFQNSLDIPAVLESMGKRFSGEWILLFRGHPKMLQIEMEQCVYVTGYEDMQEILLCADALITDFSSVMWDYMLLQRPGFLYIPDLEELEKEDRFYTKVEDWPFEYAVSNQQLCNIIEHYEEQKAMDKIEAHKQLLESVETGQACEKVSDYIYKKVCS